MCLTLGRRQPVQTQERQKERKCRRLGGKGKKKEKTYPQAD